MESSPDNVSSRGTARCFQVHANDNVATLLEDAPIGRVSVLGPCPRFMQAIEPIARSHKIALMDLAAGDRIVKFGVPIGRANHAIKCGSWIHLHNIASDFDTRSGTLDVDSGAPTDTPYV